MGSKGYFNPRKKRFHEAIKKSVIKGGHEEYHSLAARLRQHARRTGNKQPGIGGKRDIPTD
jgi:hypothetical protein